MSLPQSTDPADTHPDARSGSQAAHARAIVGLVTAGLMAGLLTWAVATGSSALQSFDTQLTDFTRSWADPLGWPVDLAHLIGIITAPFFSALAASVLVIVLWMRHLRAAAGLLALSGLAGVATSETVKALMGRMRPPGAEQFESDLDKSFPSGHAMEGIYLYLATGLVLIHLGRAQGRAWMARLGVVLVVIGPMIGLSRLVLGVHWPSDVLAGWAFGSVVLLAAALILWAPVDRGWELPRSSHAVGASGGGAGLDLASPPRTPATPAPPEGGATPDPPGR